MRISAALYPRARRSWYITWFEVIKPFDVNDTVHCLIAFQSRNNLEHNDSCMLGIHLLNAHMPCLYPFYDSKAMDVFRILNDIEYILIVTTRENRTGVPSKHIYENTYDEFVKRSKWCEHCASGFKKKWRPFYLHGLTLVPIWICNHASKRVCAEITYPIHRWSFCNGFIYLELLELKSFHVSKSPTTTTTTTTHTRTHSLQPSYIWALCFLFSVVVIGCRQVVVESKLHTIVVTSWLHN